MPGKIIETMKPTPLPTAMTVEHDRYITRGVDECGRVLGKHIKADLFNVRRADERGVHPPESESERPCITVKHGDGYDVLEDLAERARGMLIERRTTASNA